MKIEPKGIAILIIAAALTVCYAEDIISADNGNQATGESLPPAIIENIVGTAEVLKAGSVEWGKAQKDMVLGEGDKIRTLGKDGGATIKFEDGSRVDIINEASLTIAELRESRGQKEKKTILDLESGAMKALFERIKPDEESHFQVRTPTSVCGVLGTTVYVDATTGTIYVAKGKLKVKNLLTGEEFSVGEGQIMTISATGETAGPQEATEDQIQNMVNNFSPLETDILGYTPPAGGGGDEVIIFTPEAEGAASKV